MAILRLLVLIAFASFVLPSCASPTHDGAFDLQEGGRAEVQFAGGKPHLRLTCGGPGSLQVDARDVSRIVAPGDATEVRPPAGTLVVVSALYGPVSLTLHARGAEGWSVNVFPRTEEPR